MSAGVGTDEASSGNGFERLFSPPKKAHQISSVLAKPFILIIKHKSSVSFRDRTIAFSVSHQNGLNYVDGMT